MDKQHSLLKKVEKLFNLEQYQAIIDLLSDETLNEYNNSDLFAWKSWAGIRKRDTIISSVYAKMAVDVDPNNSFAYRMRGIYFDNEKEYDKAIADYDKAIELKPDYSDAFSNRGTAWRKKKEYDKAFADYDKAIELKPDYSDAYNNRGNAWSDKKEYDKAIADYNKAIELDPDNSIIYYNRGNAWLGNKEYDKAFADYDKAIELDQDNSIVYYNRGNAWSDKKEYDKAIADYNKAIELDPDNSNTYHNRGIAWSDKKEYDKAIADYNKAIELDPDNSNTYHNRGIAWRDKKEYDKAIADYDKAIELDPDNSNTYHSRGIAWRDKKEYDKAIADYDKAIELDPDSALRYFGRGMCFDKIHDYKAAIKDYQYAFVVDNSLSFINEYIKSSQEKLEEAEILLKSKAEQRHKNEKQKIEQEIDVLISTIRTLSKSKVKTVVHYTKVYVAEIYVKDLRSKMHYSNAIYMNDPMEGKVLFDYLDEKSIETAYRNGEKRTETSVYLGSFLPAEDNDGEISHEDELVMWRTYGKDENGKEAMGCSVVLNSDFFTAQLINEDQSVQDISEELLNVIYVKKLKDEPPLKRGFMIK